MLFVFQKGDKVLSNSAKESVLKECAILYIDDGHNIEIAKKFLSYHVKKCYTASDEEEGYTLFRLYRPDIIITDLNTSPKGGIGLIEKIRNIDPNAVIISIGQSKNTEFYAQAIALEVNCFLVQPVAFPYLAKTLRKFASLVYSQKQDNFYASFVQKTIDMQSNILFVLDEKFNIIMANRRFYDAFGVENLDEFETRFKDDKEIILDCKFYDENIEKFDPNTVLEIVENPEKNHIATIMNLANYKVKAFLVHGNRTRNFKGDVEFLISFTDVTSYEMDKRRLEKKISLDPLTQIYNRQMFEDVFFSELNMLKRYGQPCSIMFCEVDDIEEISATYGKNFSDRVLSTIARFIEKNIRTVDISLRWGNREIILVLPYTTKEEAVGLAKRLSRTVVSCKFDNDLAFTCSFGIAGMNTDDTSKSIIERGKLAIGEAKAMGFDSIRVV